LFSSRLRLAVGAVFIWFAPLSGEETEAVSADAPVYNESADGDAPAAGPAFWGDARFRFRNVAPRGSTALDADPRFRRNAYFSQRTRLRYKDSVEAGWLLKRGSAGPALGAENIDDFLLQKYSLQARGASADFVAGDYSLTYGQGLAFYEGLGEFVRPAKIRARGARADYSSSPNAFLRGAVVEGEAGPWRGALFASKKFLDLRVSTATGRVDENIDNLRDDLGDFHDEAALADNNSTAETLFGARAAYRAAGAGIGVTGYRLRYDRVVDPGRRAFSYAHVFRGDEALLGAVDFDFSYDRLSVAGEIAQSRAAGHGVPSQRGGAWTVTPLFSAKPWTFWTNLFDYDPFFFSRHGKGPAFSVLGGEGLADNQRGALFGTQVKTRRYAGVLNYALASFPEALGSGTGTSPIQPSSARRFYFENTWSVSPVVGLLFRAQFQEEDVYQSLMDGGARQHAVRRTQKYRYQTAWRAGRSRFTARYETRWEEVEGRDGRAFGYYLMGDVVHPLTPALAVNARVYFFDSPAAALSTGVEDIWGRVPYYRFAGNMNDLQGTPGTRFYVSVRQRLGRNADLWMKADVNRRPDDLSGIQPTRSSQESKAFSAARHGFHAQLDIRWGAS